MRSFKRTPTGRVLFIGSNDNKYLKIYIVFYYLNNNQGVRLKKITTNGEVKKYIYCMRLTIDSYKLKLMRLLYKLKTNGYMRLL